MPDHPAADVVVIGGGIVGLAVAAELTARRPGCRVVVLEKESSLGAHQTTHNSGVVHSGIYYRPGSLKAALCLEGRRRLLEFCQEHGIPTAVVGKVIVATTPEEVPRLRALYERGQANGVPDLALIGPDRLRDVEPHAAGLHALHVPGAAVVDFGRVARALGDGAMHRGAEIRTSTNVRRVAPQADGWVVETDRGALGTRSLVSCAGLFADRLARTAGGEDDVRIVPFRGDYYDLVPERRALVRGMIYPVPDPQLPFLGVHVTRTVDGTVHVGPNAVLALKREGYTRTDWDWQDLSELARFGGFWRMTRRFWRAGLSEAYRSWSRRALVRSVQRLVPEIRASDLRPGGSGVRAQAVGADGRLLDDFDLVEQPGAVFVRNAPSPAATACLAIARHVADRLAAVGAVHPRHEQGAVVFTRQ